MQGLYVCVRCLYVLNMYDTYIYIYTYSIIYIYIQMRLYIYTYIHTHAYGGLYRAIEGLCTHTYTYKDMHIYIYMYRVHLYHIVILIGDGRWPQFDG